MVNESCYVDKLDTKFGHLSCERESVRVCVCVCHEYVYNMLGFGSICVCVSLGLLNHHDYFISAGVSGSNFFLR